MVVDIERVERVADEPRFERMIAGGLEAMGEGDRLLGAGRDIESPLLKSLAIDQQLEPGMMRQTCRNYGFRPENRAGLGSQDGLARIAGW